MRFSVGGKLSKEKWSFDGTEMEEVRTFNYLGFVLVRVRAITAAT